MNTTRKRNRWSAPLFRWAGSKKQLIPFLRCCIPQSFRRYIEPFAGSACLFFSVRPSQAVLGDINDELLFAYQQIRLHPRLVARACMRLKPSAAEYYRVRSLAPSELSPIDRAARFAYLNRYCFNGVYRTNRQGNFNVPRGIKTGLPPTEAAFVRCAFALRYAELRVGDFENCLNDIKSEDFVYLDPPYASTNRPTFGEYGYGSFTGDDITRLAIALNTIDRKGGSFLLSYSTHPELLKAVKSWNVQKIGVRRHVAGFARHRGVVPEVLVSNIDLPPFDDLM